MKSWKKIKDLLKYERFWTTLVVVDLRERAGQCTIFFFTSLITNTTGNRNETGNRVFPSSERTRQVGTRVSAPDTTLVRGTVPLAKIRYINEQSKK